MTKTYTLTSTIWLYEGPTAWHFISIDPETSKDIDHMFAHARRGWGSLPVNVTIGKTTWKTSIFPDKKRNGYLLPLKADVRKKESLKAGDTVELSIEITD